MQSGCLENLNIGVLNLFRISNFVLQISGLSGLRFLHLNQTFKYGALLAVKADVVARP